MSDPHLKDPINRVVSSLLSINHFPKRAVINILLELVPEMIVQLLQFFESDIGTEKQ